MQVDSNQPFLNASWNQQNIVKHQGLQISSKVIEFVKSSVYANQNTRLRLEKYNVGINWRESPKKHYNST